VLLSDFDYHLPDDLIAQEPLPDRAGSRMLVVDRTTGKWEDRAFRDFPPVLKEMQDRFSYILIDEYQDTNRAQYLLAHVLAQRHKNICVVGDPDQSIYAWRGADIRNILEFEQDYPDAKVVRLEQNYRSTKTILSIASKLIAHNTQRKDKSLWTENDQGDKATLYLAGDEHDEAYAVAKRLKELKEAHNYSWNQMARCPLYRGVSAGGPLFTM